MVNLDLVWCFRDSMCPTTAAVKLRVQQRDTYCAGTVRHPFGVHRIMPAEDVIKAFKKFDKDGNGVISRSELSSVSRQQKRS